jgi:hypothetical protein
MVANDGCDPHVLRRAGVEHRLAVLIGERRVLLNRFHKAPALVRIGAGRQISSVAFGIQDALQDFAGMQYLLGASRVWARIDMIFVGGHSKEGISMQPPFLLHAAVPRASRVQLGWR